MQIGCKTISLPDKNTLPTVPTSDYRRIRLQQTCKSPFHDSKLVLFTLTQVNAEERFSACSESVLTECVGEPLGLVVVHYSHTQCVQAHQTQHCPVEALRLHHAPDEEADSLFFPAQIRGALILAALHAGPGERGALGSWVHREGNNHRFVFVVA